jgi:hypothetical protein
LSELQRILASSPSTTTESPDAVTTILSGVPIDRIRQITSLLGKQRGTEMDAADLIAMRVLLADYVDAVGRLRAVTKLTEEDLARVGASIKKGDGRLVERELQNATRLERAKAERNER